MMKVLKWAYELLGVEMNIGLMPDLSVFPVSHQSFTKCRPQAVRGSNINKTFEFATMLLEDDAKCISCITYFIEMFC